MMRCRVGLTEVASEHVPSALAEQVRVERAAPVDLGGELVAERVVKARRVGVELVDFVERLGSLIEPRLILRDATPRLDLPEGVGARGTRRLEKRS